MIVFTNHRDKKPTFDTRNVTENNHIKCDCMCNLNDYICKEKNEFHV